MHRLGLSPSTSTFAVVGLLVAVVATVLITVPRSESTQTDPQPGTETTPSATAENRPYRAFKAGSWWNTPLPYDPPPNPAGNQILKYLSTAPQSGKGCLMLAGAGRSPWGQPIYWAKPGDPVYDLNEMKYMHSSEIDGLRIPASAQPAANSDGTMTIFDRQKNYVVALTNAEYDSNADEWTASGATVTYLNSNGLHVDTGRSDDSRNSGTHRGNNGATMAARWDMVSAGLINHVLKIASGPETSDRAVFPMIGSDGDYLGKDVAIPPQGLRLRLKPSLDLDSLDLHEDALVIARALQRYGAYIGDSGSVTALKLENTRAEGRGQLWDLKPNDLCRLPFTPKYWDVLAEGYDPTAG